MSRKIKTGPGPGEQPAKPNEQLTAGQKVDLAAALSTKSEYGVFNIWVVGMTPLIVHAWSHKAKLEMLGAQVKVVKGKGRARREPERDFFDSLYRMVPGEEGQDGPYGFPATGLKKAFLSGAHKDKGIAKTAVLSNLWINSTMVDVPTAFGHGSVCTMPLVRVWGDKPEMREDMVRIGSGIQKTANLAYRGQFRHWAINLTGRFNMAAISQESLAFLIDDAGKACGLGEWRNEKSGVFGSFHLATADEEKAWKDFADGKGPQPAPLEDPMLLAA